MTTNSGGRVVMVSFCCAGNVACERAMTSISKGNVLFNIVVILFFSLTPRWSSDDSLLFRFNLFTDLAKPSLPFLVIDDRFIELLIVEVRPVGLGEIELRVGGLP